MLTLIAELTFCLHLNQRIAE